MKITMLEKDLQSLFIKKIKKIGGLAVKVDCTSKRGWPDLIVILDCEIRLVEMKQKTGRLSLHQKLVHDALRKQAVSVSVIDSVESIDQFILDYHYDPY